MVSIDCPWCEAPQPLAPLPGPDPEEILRCAECGTTVLLVDEPSVLAPAA